MIDGIQRAADTGNTEHLVCSHDRDCCVEKGLLKGTAVIVGLTVASRNGELYFGAVQQIFHGGRIFQRIGQHGAVAADDRNPQGSIVRETVCHTLHGHGILPLQGISDRQCEQRGMRAQLHHCCGAFRASVAQKLQDAEHADA